MQQAIKLSVEGVFKMFEIGVSRSFILCCVIFISAVSISANTFNFHSISSGIFTDKIVETPTDGGIRESIPNEFRKNYDKWKTDMLSTEFGKNQWGFYAGNSRFILKIEVADKNNRGAGTGDYLWNEKGELVGATIVLGGKLDKGFPDPANFPVMNSISAFNLPGEIADQTLAASKIVHEFGHVNQTANSKREKIELENSLIPVYNSIFLKNGYNTLDAKLTDLENKMGGTPVQIWENREYFGEENAMKFLLEKVKTKDFYCNFLDKISDNVNLFSKENAGRFNAVVSSNSVGNCKK